MNAVTQMIKGYFDKNEWKYDLEEDIEANLDLFRMGFTMNNETVNILIQVYRERERYKIIGYPDSKIPMTCLNGGLRAVNESNSEINQGCFYLRLEDGMIIFFIATNTDGLHFSEEVFAADLDFVTIAIDTQTAQIIKKAISYDPSCIPQKRGLFSRFKRNS